MTRAIAGTIDYQRSAELHRPTDPRAIAVEIRRLHAGGLKPRDVAIALRLDLSAVLQAIGAPTSDSHNSNTGDPNMNHCSSALETARTRLRAALQKLEAEDANVVAQQRKVQELKTVSEQAHAELEAAESDTAPDLENVVRATDDSLGAAQRIALKATRLRALAAAELSAARSAVIAAAKQSAHNPTPITNEVSP